MMESPDRTVFRMLRIGVQQFLNVVRTLRIVRIGRQNVHVGQGLVAIVSVGSVPDDEEHTDSFPVPMRAVLFGRTDTSAQSILRRPCELGGCLCGDSDRYEQQAPKYEKKFSSCHGDPH